MGHLLQNRGLHLQWKNKLKFPVYMSISCWYVDISETAFSWSDSQPLPQGPTRLVFQLALAALVAAQASPVDTKKAVEAKGPQLAAEAGTEVKRNKKR